MFAWRRTAKYKPIEVCEAGIERRGKASSHSGVQVASYSIIILLTLAIGFSAGRYTEWTSAGDYIGRLWLATSHIMQTR
jgi:hypothetical protein